VETEVLLLGARFAVAVFTVRVSVGALLLGSSQATSFKAVDCGCSLPLLLLLRDDGEEGEVRELVEEVTEAKLAAALSFSACALDEERRRIWLD